MLQAEAAADRMLRIIVYYLAIALSYYRTIAYRIIVLSDRVIIRMLQ